jgi:hypothetical protein
MTTTTIARVAKFFPRGVDTFLREGTLNADRQVQASTQRNPDNRERRLRGSGAPLPWGLDDPAKATGTPSMARNDCMNERKKISTRLAAGLLLAILFDTALQLIWKSAVLALEEA